VPLNVGRITLKKVEGLHSSSCLEAGDAHITLVFDRQALLFQAVHLAVDRVGFVLKLSITGTVSGNPPIVKVFGVNDEAVEVSARALEHRAEPLWQGCDRTGGMYWLGMDRNKVGEVVDPIAVGVSIHETVLALLDPFCRMPESITDRDFEVGVVSVELEVFRGVFEHFLISHEVVSESLYLFRK
jgi:hypothetical protein